jgi:hypothetical protein
MSFLCPSDFIGSAMDHVEPARSVGCETGKELSPRLVCSAEVTREALLGCWRLSGWRDLAYILLW